MANGNGSAGNTTNEVYSASLMNDQNCKPHSVVNMSNMSEILASSAAAYAHGPNLLPQSQSNGTSSSSLVSQQDELSHTSVMSKAPVAKTNGIKKKPIGVPMFNHKNTRDWIHKRAAYNKED